MFRQSHHHASTLPNNHTQVNKLLVRLSGVYREPSRVLNDAVSLLNSTTGQHLRPDIHDLLQNDGTIMRSLRLSGTIQMFYRGNAYHIPIDMHLPSNYGVRPPIVFVRPVPSMMIKQGHKHVGVDGMVYMPYLHSWRSRTHNLVEAVRHMSDLFGKDPPVFARPAGATSASVSATVASPSTFPPTSTTPPPPPQYNIVTQEQERLRQIEREANEANEAVRIAREAERQELEEQQYIQQSQQTLTERSQSILSSYVQSSKQEIEVSLEDQILLEKSREFVTGVKNAGIYTGGRRGEEGDRGKGQIVYLTKRKEELQQYHTELDSSITELQSFITEAQNTQKSSSDIPVDELAVPADIHSAQMLVLSAENAAIHDALYYLDKALSENKISLEIHLKAVRRLAKRQFLIKAHLLKIGQVKAQEFSSGSMMW